MPADVPWHFGFSPGTSYARFVHLDSFEVNDPLLGLIIVHLTISISSMPRSSPNRHKGPLSEFPANRRVVAMEWGHAESHNPIASAKATPSRIWG
jgi:hypothetical protein